MKTFKDLTVLLAYQPRFLTAEQYAQGINYYHLARAAGKHSRYERILWASAEIAREYGIGRPGAYKDLSAGITGN